MNMIILLAMVAAFGLCAWLLINRKRGTFFANIAEGVHQEAVYRYAEAAITVRHLLYKKGTADDQILVCAAAEVPIGSVKDEVATADLTDQPVAVNLLGRGSTKLLVASEAITAGELVYTAAAGKVQDEPTGATVYQVGVALTAAAADGDIIEVDTCTPVQKIFA